MRRRFASLLLPVAALVLLNGCGGTKLHPVEGVVTLDGTPIEGATVSFVSDDGKKTFAGQTDASGKYTMVTGDKPGIAAGSYKVIVHKAKTFSGDLTPGGADYMKSMQKMSKESGVKDPSAGGGLFIPGSTAGGTPQPKGELPLNYSSTTTSPFKATVPVTGPVNLELKADTKKK